MANKRFFPNSNKKYLQTNRTDVYPLANLVSTWNIDTESLLGPIRISPRLKVNTSTADDANLGLPVAFKYFDSKIFAICGSRVFKTTGFTPDSGFTIDSSTGYASDYNVDESDMDIFNAELCTTTTDELISKAANGSGTGAWTSRDTLTGGNPHLCKYFRKFDRLYYTNISEQILSINTGWVTADVGADYAMQLTRRDHISAMKPAQNFIWIGTQNIQSSGDTGYLYAWDGISPTPQGAYPINSNGVMAIVIKDDLPYILNDKGIFSVFNGNGFDEVGRLPFGNIKPYNAFQTGNSRYIHPNGIYVTKNGTIRMLINNTSGTDVPENMASGIWEYSKEKGLYHVQSFTYNPKASTTITDFGQNIISAAGALEPMDTGNTNTVDGSFLAGATIYTDVSTTTSGIFLDNSLDTIRKSGYFVTTWFESEQIEDNWQRMWEIHRRLLNSTDRMVFKYRLEEEVPVQAAITWVNTTTFTTATDVTGYRPTVDGFDGTYGGEVEVLRGTGGGVCRHIKSVSDVSGGLYTVVLDTAVTGVTTGTATARFQKWVKLIKDPATNEGEIAGQVLGYTAMPIAKNSPRIQFKGYMEWTGKNEFHKLALYSTDFIETQE